MTLLDFENLLKQTMGLDAASVGRTTIERAVRLRMADVGLVQMEDYGHRLRTSNDELQELIETVVVPETWFFRDTEAFAGLVRLVREEWLPAHPTAILRMLSVPCCSGEEPYSMVMALLDGGFPQGRIKVDAQDISARALARAKRGTYGVNSFRGLDLTFRDRYFRPTANGHCLSELLSNMVNFRQRNLLSADFPFGEESYDVIFCRNLLIYFDRSTQQSVMRTLARLLAPDGFLFVGPAEAFLATCSGFTSASQSMSYAFRKADAKCIESRDTSSARPKKPVEKHWNLRAQHPVKPDLTPTPVLVPTAPPMDLGTARRLADAGRLLEAADWCEAHLRQQGSSSEGHYLSGLIQDAIGNRQRAAECYRKALYLEPEHAEALTHLALLTDRQGDTVAAQRLRERARRAQGNAVQTT